jgi:hypothetical protein
VKGGSPFSGALQDIANTEGSMLNREWEREYEEILKEGKKTGELEILPEKKEQRSFPRFRIKSGAVWIRMDLSFDVVDVSVSGISIYSSHPFASKQVFAVTLGKVFRIEAEVIDCSLVESDRQFLETRYLVRCSFLDSHSAMRFLVMLKELNDPELDFSVQ